MQDDLAAERALLHAHGRAGAWGSLGLWQAPQQQDYASACAALATAVMDSAADAPKPATRWPQRVLLLGCGAGQELALLLKRWPQAQVLGIEADAARAQQAQAAGWDVQQGDALAPPPGPWDLVLAIDAAYHFSPRTAWLRAVRAALAPRGRLAYTDLVASGGRASSALLRRLAPMAGVSGADVLSEAAAVARLREAGFGAAKVRRLDAQVLDGFAHFVPAQAQRLGASAQALAWRRVQGTAAALPWCRKLGLGYALFSASAAPGAMRSATSKAEATAASSNGMPTRA